jgi:hypothetical protein
MGTKVSAMLLAYVLASEIKTIYESSCLLSEEEQSNLEMTALLQAK